MPVKPSSNFVPCSPPRNIFLNVLMKPATTKVNAPILKTIPLVGVSILCTGILVVLAALGIHFFQGKSVNASNNKECKLEADNTYQQSWEYYCKTADPYGLERADLLNPLPSGIECNLPTDQTNQIENSRTQGYSICDSKYPIN